MTALGITNLLEQGAGTACCTQMFPFTRARAVTATMTLCAEHFQQRHRPPQEGAEAIDLVMCHIENEEFLAVNLRPDVDYGITHRPFALVAGGGGGHGAFLPDKHH